MLKFKFFLNKSKFLLVYVYLSGISSYQREERTENQHATCDQYTLSSGTRNIDIKY